MSQHKVQNKKESGSTEAVRHTPLQRMSSIISISIFNISLKILVVFNAIIIF